LFSIGVWRAQVKVVLFSLPPTRYLLATVPSPIISKSLSTALEESPEQGGDGLIHCENLSLYKHGITGPQVEEGGYVSFSKTLETPADKGYCQNIVVHGLIVLQDHSGKSRGIWYFYREYEYVQCLG
jgi:hypothetical protein